MNRTIAQKNEEFIKNGGDQCTVEAILKATEHQMLLKARFEARGKDRPGFVGCGLGTVNQPEHVSF